MTITTEELLARMLVISEGRDDNELQRPTGTCEAVVRALEEQRHHRADAQLIYSTVTKLNLPLRRSTVELMGRTTKC